MNSMTGFGKGVNETENGIYTVEMRSVNNRYLDISVKLPRDFLGLEERIKGVIRNRLSRGKVDVFVTYQCIGEGMRHVRFDKTLAGAYFSALREASETYGVHFNAAATDLFRMPDVLTLEREKLTDEEAWKELLPAAEAAAEALCSMRHTEGMQLRTVLEDLLNGTEKMFEGIVEKAPAVPAIYAAKLKERLDNFAEAGSLPDPQRIAAEVAMFADRCNVDEEIARFRSHILQFRDMLKSEEPIGRKMDFLVQELNREINTVGSKANDIGITDIVIDVKSEIEKIREQIQNIE